MTSRPYTRSSFLLFLMVICCMPAVAQSTLKEGTYYLYNKASGRFLMAGGNWGTQAVLGDHAIPLTLEEAGEGSYYIRTGFDKSGEGYLSPTNWRGLSAKGSQAAMSSAIPMAAT